MASSYSGSICRAFVESLSYPLRSTGPFFAFSSSRTFLSLIGPGIFLLHAQLGAGVHAWRDTVLVQAMTPRV